MQMAVGFDLLLGCENTEDSKQHHKKQKEVRLEHLCAQKMS